MEKQYELTWYDAAHQDQMGRIVLTLTPGQVRSIFNLAADDDGNNCYIISPEHESAFAEFFSEFNFERFRYFLDHIHE